MKLKELKDLVATIKYKPGAKLELTGDEFLGTRNYAAWSEPMGEPVAFLLEMAVPDAYNPGSMTTIKHHRMLHLYDVREWDRDQALRKIFDFLLESERHEAGEFFVVDGVRPFDPHK